MGGDATFPRPQTRVILSGVRRGTVVGPDAVEGPRGSYQRAAKRSSQTIHGGARPKSPPAFFRRRRLGPSTARRCRVAPLRMTNLLELVWLGFSRKRTSPQARFLQRTILP